MFFLAAALFSKLIIAGMFAQPRTLGSNRTCSSAARPSHRQMTAAGKTAPSANGRFGESRPRSGPVRFDLGQRLRSHSQVGPWGNRDEAGDMTFITLTPDTLANEHICCAISDKKCADGYAAKKKWLADQYPRGYRFTRLDERGKVFIEYGPGEYTWMPVVAPNWMVMGCFWVSGRFKKQGNGKALLRTALADAERQGRAGLVSVVGKKKMHFQSDGKWLLRQGFHEVDETESGFSLLMLETGAAQSAERPHFAQTAKQGLASKAKGVTVYYSNRCPFTEFHINTSLKETCEKRNLPLTIIKLESLEAAQNAPTPATIFSLFVDGIFVTTDLSACMDSRFDKAVERAVG